MFTLTPFQKLTKIMNHQGITSWPGGGGKLNSEIKTTNICPQITIWNNIKSPREYNKTRSRTNQNVQRTKLWIKYKIELPVKISGRDTCSSCHTCVAISYCIVIVYRCSLQGYVFTLSHFLCEDCMFHIVFNLCFSRTLPDFCSITNIILNGD